MKTKLLIFLTLAPMTFNVMAEIKMVQPDLELGHWVTTIDSSAMVDHALASVPEGEGGAEAREMMQKLMPKSTEVSFCLTLDYFTDMEKNLVSGAGADEANNCETTVLESTRNKTVVHSRCSEGDIKVTTNYVNTKRYESTVAYDFNDSGQERKATMTSIARWKSVDCSAVVENNVKTATNALGAMLGGILGGQSQRQESRTKSRAKQAENRAVDKGVGKVIDKVFGKLFK